MGNAAGADKLKDIANKTAKDITEETIIMINKALDADTKDHTPTNLIEVIQHFVGLLRNKKEAKNVDVQLYLEDFVKLQFKLEYIDARTLTTEIVKIH